jgi:uncharacterized protein YbbK (DUF523 family)
MPKILISACLLGQKVRYDGNDCLQTHAKLQALIKSGDVIPICPEMAGGLPTPRPPAEIKNALTGTDVLNGKAEIRTIDGMDVTIQFVKGAYKALDLVREHNIRVAILKAQSPSCGSTQIYNGDFSNTLISGMGVTAALLSQYGVRVFDEYHIDEAFKFIESI